MVAKRIENSIKTYFWKNQFSNRKYLGTWVNLDDTASYDGPTILQILISSFNPSTRVGVSDLNLGIRTTKLNRFQNNCVDICENVITDYEMINEQGGRDNDIVLDLFNSLLSGKHKSSTDLSSAAKMIGRLVHI